MLLRDFKAAHLQAPRGRSHDPSWLDGSAKGRPAFILGGAGGLVDSPGLAAAKGQIVIGTNWTLRLLEPTIWLVVDGNVWKSESARISGCSDSMVTVVSKGIFGGGVYSVAHSQKMKMVGTKKVQPLEIRIRPFAGIQRKGKKYGLRPFPPYVPNSASELFHPGGNSLCFAIQLAHVMGCNPIVASGFTLQSGSNYHFGGNINPATRRPSVYQPDLAMAWLAWYSSAFPGRVLLDPSFDGPVTSVLRKAAPGEIERIARAQHANGGGHESDQGSKSGHEEGSLRQDV